MQNRIRGDAGRTTMICIDSYEQNVPVVRFYNYVQNSGGYSFHGLVQFLVEMEHILDSANFPQSFTAVRSFSVPTEPEMDGAAEDKSREGALATFVVKIFYRQHTSWQGSVTWLEQKCEQPFRSVLELTLLMDSALSGNSESMPM